MTLVKVNLDVEYNDINYHFDRHAMTIHKRQGQTFEFVGVDLCTSVFNNSRLYMPISRFKRQCSLKLIKHQQ